jgi:hypothetical protein
MKTYQTATTNSIKEDHHHANSENSDVDLLLPIDSEILLVLVFETIRLSHVNTNS